MKSQPSAGFTVVEMLVVICLSALLLATVASSFLGQGGELRTMKVDYRQFLGILDQARFGALTGDSNWLVEIDCATGVVRAGPDDGWLGTLTQPASGSVSRRTYYDGSADFNLTARKDGSLQPIEQTVSMIFQATTRFVDSPDDGYSCPQSISFTPDGIDSLLVLWIAHTSFQPEEARELQSELIRPIVILSSGFVHLPYEG